MVCSPSSRTTQELVFRRRYTVGRDFRQSLKFKSGQILQWCHEDLILLSPFWYSKVRLVDTRLRYCSSPVLTASGEVFLF